MEDANAHISGNEPAKHDQTPKRKRDDPKDSDGRTDSPDRGKGGTSHGGKTCCLLPVENEISASSESEVDGSLLIETLAREQGMYDLEDSHGASSWLVPVDPTMIPKMVIPGADHHKVQVKK